MKHRRKRAYPTTPGTLGDYLRTLRVNAGLRQEDLAERMYVNPSGLSLIEMNKRRPSKAMLLIFAQAIGLSEVDRDLLLLLAGHCPDILVDRPRENLRAMVKYWHTQAEHATEEAA